LLGEEFGDWDGELGPVLEDFAGLIYRVRLHAERGTNWVVTEDAPVEQDGLAFVP
jgi:hypothetical protein